MNKHILVIVASLVSFSIGLLLHTTPKVTVSNTVHISYDGGENYYKINSGETAIGPWGDTQRTCRVRTITGEIRFAPIEKP